MRPSVPPVRLVLTLVGALSAASVAAQQTTGRIEATVTDATGVAVGSVEATVLGTALRVVADTAGRFVFPFVPAGLHTVRVQALGLEPQDQEVRVWAGEVARLTIQLGAPAAPAARPTVHPDPFAARWTLTGDFLSSAPFDDPRQALCLVPGVLTRGAAMGLEGATNPAVRSSRHGGAATYIDGAPVRFGLLGIQELSLGTGMIEEMSVTTGAASPLAPDGQGGVIAYVTPTGGERFRARLHVDTDEPFGDGVTVGYNRLEAAAGGPLPRVTNLRWFAAVSGQGQRSQYRGMGAEAEPTYALGGRDTTVFEIDALGNAVSVELPRFVQFSGTCGTIGSTGSAAGRDIANNYGFECQGLRRAMDWSSSLRALGKLSYSFGGTSIVSLTGLATGVQQRGFPGSLIGAPSLYVGAHRSSRLLVLDAHHQVALGNRPVALSLNLSRGVDRAVAGPLATLSELDTRAPGLGIELGTLQFTGAGLIPFPLTDQIIRNIRTNVGVRVPFLDRTDLRRSQPWRMNPFGLRGGGWPTQGLDGELIMWSEARVKARGRAEWELSPRHRLAIGADAGWTDLSFYAAGLISQAFMDAFIAHPRRLGIAATDRLEIGPLTLEVGARFERVNVGALFPRVPYRIFTHPRYNQLYSSAGTDDQVYAAFLADTGIWVPSRPQSALSPSLRVAYQIERNTVARAAYSRHLESPVLAEWLTGLNLDLSFTNTSSPVGRDLDLVTSTLYEAGLRHRFGVRVAADVALFRQENPLPYRVRVRGFDDPANPGDTLNADVLTAVTGESLKGMVGRLEWQAQSWLSLGGSLSQITGAQEDGPPTTTHAVSGVATVTVPSGLADAGVPRALLDGLEAYVLFRAVSGLAYTRLANNGAGFIVPGPAPVFGQIEAPLSSRLPWNKYLDLRVSKPVSLGRYQGSVYLDIRNVLAWRNVERLFSETSDVANPQHRAQFVSSEFFQLQSEATSAGALVGNDVMLNDCSTWTSAVNCVMLRRTEARFGNGDGTYTQAEQTIALNAWYDSIYAPWTFYGPGRTVRVGVQASF